MSETLRDAAVSYARDYGFAVVPLVPRQKHPATEHGFNEWAASIEEIEQTWARQPLFNVGASMGAPSGNIICIDIDVDDDKGYDGMEFLRKWEREHGELPETVMAITGRGGSHLFYRVDREVRPSTNDELHIDIRGDGSGIVLPPSVHPDTGREYQWENHPEDYPFADADDSVYALIDAVRPKGYGEKGKRFELPERISEGSRNDTLLKYACSLQAKGRDDAEIMDAVQGANITRCKPSLKSTEVEKIVFSALGYDKGDSADKKKGKARSGSRMPHNEFAKMLVKEDHVCIIGGAPAVWDGRCYVPGNDAIDRAIIKRDDTCRRKERGEIREYIRLQAPEVDPADPVKVAFENGVLDVTTSVLEKRSPKLVITNVVPHSYDPGAYDKVTDVFLNKISCNNATIRANLEELIGLCMYRSNDIGICAVLLGSGSNGKSVFLAAVRNAIGAENVSSLDLSMIGKRFHTGLLLGKLANIGDDIANGKISGESLSVFKKVVTGERVFSDVKGSVGFEFDPYCKLIFSANEMPSLGDTSDGVMRRLFPIPFDAVFKRTDADFDPRVKEKVTSENAAKYLCALGVKGLQRVLAQHGMTPNARSAAMNEEIRIDGDPVVQWVQSECIDPDKLVGRPTKTVHAEYLQWCSDTCSEVFGIRKFTRRVNEQFGLKSSNQRHEFADGSRVVPTFLKRTVWENRTEPNRTEQNRT